jgi:hypothetical protein
MTNRNRELLHSRYTVEPRIWLSFSQPKGASFCRINGHNVLSGFTCDVEKTSRVIEVPL